MNPVQRREVAVVALLILLVIGALWWHDHNQQVAQAALFTAQLEKQEADKKEADAQLSAMRSQVDALKGLAANQAQEIQNLNTTLTSLNATLVGLRQKETQQLQAVQSMNTDQLTDAIIKQLNLKGVTYNSQTQTAEGVTPETLRTLATQGVELQSCQEQRDNLTKQVSTCDQLSAKQAAQIEREQQISNNLQRQLDLTTKADQEQIKVLQAQVKVVKGSFVHRAWNKIKFPLGMILGAALGHAI